MWIIFLVTPVIAAVVSGLIVGLVTRSRSWSNKRIQWTIFSAMALLTLTGALIENHLQLPTLAAVLSKSGYHLMALLANVVYAFIFGLSLSLAANIARRFDTREKTEL